MNKALLSCLTCLAFTTAISRASEGEVGMPPGKPDAAREYVNLDPDWRFRIGESPAAMEPMFDDSGWRIVNVPHDWSIEGPFEPGLGSGNGFAPGGIAWYRRHFQVSAADAGRSVTAEFDGVYDNCEVWLNGFLVGARPYGFESFICDISQAVRFGGADNVLCVRVDHSRTADSRWYTGSGIYRNVRLCVTSSLHVAHWGTAVTSQVAENGAASIHIETKVQNDSSEPKTFTLVSEVLDQSGRVTATVTTKSRVDGRTEASLAQEAEVPRPERWSLEEPRLYSLHSHVADQGETDDAFTSFGIRTLGFDPNLGFSLNGVPVKLKGVCIHQDGGSVGVAIPVRIWERRLLALKALGVNAIRTSHNPPAPEFLDLCDRMGFLVMDEAFDEFTPAKNKWIEGWNVGVPSRYGYSEQFGEWSVRDIRDIVLRDRNHPSIIMWSIGNEIDGANDPFTDPVLGKNFRPGNPPASDMVKWGRPLVEEVKRFDRTRPVTAALATVEMSNAAGFAQILDVAGYNYQEYRYASDHLKYPERFIYGSENSHSYSAWIAVRDNAAVCGQFLWTGIDYLGEARPWPARANPDGLLDLCGFIKPLGRFRQSLWSEKPMVYLCAEEAGDAQKPEADTSKPVGKETWNWPDNAPLIVSCYTNCPEVTLFLNGFKIGSEATADSKEGVLRWELPFSKGILKAVGRKEGHETCEFELRTAGAPCRMELHADVTQIAADGKDVAQIEYDVVDEKGVRIPDAGSEIDFTLSGPVRMLGIGNGDVSNCEPVQTPRHRAFQGRGLMILQSTGEKGAISVVASGDGLQPAAISLASR